MGMYQQFAPAFMAFTPQWELTDEANLDLETETL